MSLRLRTYLLLIGSLNIGFIALASGVAFMCFNNTESLLVITYGALGFLLLSTLCFWFTDFKDKSAPFLPDPNSPIKKGPLARAVVMLLLFPLPFTYPKIDLTSYITLVALLVLSVIPFTLFCFWTRRIAATLPPGDPQVDWKVEQQPSTPPL